MQTAGLSQMGEAASDALIYLSGTSSPCAANGSAIMPSSKRSPRERLLPADHHNKSEVIVLEPERSPSIPSLRLTPWHRFDCIGRAIRRFLTADAPVTWTFF